MAPNEGGGDETGARRSNSHCGKRPRLRAHIFSGSYHRHIYFRGLQTTIIHSSKTEWEIYCVQQIYWNKRGRKIYLMNQRSSNRSELRPLTSQERPTFDDSFFALSTIASSSQYGKQSSRVTGTQHPRSTVLPKRRHGRLHKMGIINLDQRMKGPVASDPQHGSTYVAETEPIDEPSPVVSKSLTSLTPVGLPPLNLRPGNFTPERRPSPKNSNRPSSSRPGTAIGFGSSTDRHLLTDISTATDKQLSLEEIQQLEEMMNPNRPRTSSVRVQIKRYMSDVESKC